MSKPSTLTAEGYHAKYLKQGQPNLNRWRRYLRMLKKETSRGD
jgi:hypothetical protein